MREYKNPKSIELLQEAQAIADYVEAEGKKLLETGITLLDYHCELLTQAAKLRLMADYVEDEIISVQDLEDA